MAKAIALDVPQGDLENVRLRLSGLLTEMEAIERELGAEMDAVDPVPPVFRERTSRAERKWTDHSRSAFSKATTSGSKSFPKRSR